MARLARDSVHFTEVETEYLLDAIDAVVPRSKETWDRATELYNAAAAHANLSLRTVHALKSRFTRLWKGPTNGTGEPTARQARAQAIRDKIRNKARPEYVLARDQHVDDDPDTDAHEPRDPRAAPSGASAASRASPTVPAGSAPAGGVADPVELLLPHNDDDDDSDDAHARRVAQQQQQQAGRRAGAASQSPPAGLLLPVVASPQASESSESESESEPPRKRRRSSRRRHSDIALLAQALSSLRQVSPVPVPVPMPSAPAVVPGVAGAAAAPAVLPPAAAAAAAAAVGAAVPAVATPYCPPHDFKLSESLSILFCTRCGEVRELRK
eukprot:m51a1_g8630 hypothetical protein (326) ;mRNA; f:110130-111431